ncbi:MAG: prepilin-type N-terminal cleavage/methylation domain-containing protein [Candidatus Magnetomorum sp.]|nr:prepilin-type N-terminal cleavage/methylation domain-containing protein [Candidatus Magnetomorum sp.]
MTQTHVKSNLLAFTLVELLVAMTIISTISAISLIGFRHYLPGYRLKAAAFQIKTDMQRALSYAAKTNCQYRMVFDTDKMFVKTGSYEIQKGTAARLSTYLPEQQDQSFHIGHIDQIGIFMVSRTNNPVFQPDGSIASLATITLENRQGDQLKISTSMAGRIIIK